MKSLFSENVFNYSDAELFLFETEKTKTINGDTIMFTLFPKLGEESYVIDLNSSYIYNLFYLKEELFRIGIGDCYELDISVDRNQVDLYIDSLLNTNAEQYGFFKCINYNARNIAPPSTRR